MLPYQSKDLSSILERASYLVLSNVNVIMLCVFCNGDSEESFHLVGRDYLTLENQLEVQSRLKNRSLKKPLSTYNKKSSV